MTRIDFYFNAPDRAVLTRTLIGKAWRAGLHTLVYTGDERLASDLDQKLWTETQLSFIPHVRCGSPVAGHTPILIGTDPEALRQADLIINLGDEPPTCLARFDRLIEVVSTDPADRQRARERYRHYRSQGYAIQSHDLAAQA